ncbi:MAG: response regulator transcription factor [Balneolaceae bacterium]|nr:response regulator transcription factor [Balneolaceae bacterium]
MNCIIVDDEPSAREILEGYIKDAPGLELQKVCSDALEAIEFLKEQQIDLIFLDVNMPRLSGISFLKSLNNPPKVIMTTAYSEYALEGYELDVVDYLLKPFSFERFLKAVDKVSRHRTSPAKEKIITVKANGKLYRIELDDILYVESKGDYITLNMKNDKLTYNQTMKGFAAEVPSDQFVRVHKSFIVSLGHIKYLEGNQVKIDDTYIPVGATYREEFRKKFES